MSVDGRALKLPERPGRDAGPELALIAALEARAAAECLSGRALALKLGVSHSLWSRVRRGIDGEHFGPDSCARIVVAYPELRDAAARYLAEAYGHPSLTLLEEASRVARTRRGVRRTTDCR